MSRTWTLGIGVAAASVLGLMTERAMAQAPGTLYLVPEKFEAKVGDKLQVRVGVRNVGDDPKAMTLVDFDEKAVSWFFVRVAGTQENREALPAVQPGPAPAGGGEPGKSKTPEPRGALIPLDRAGVTMIGMDVRPRIVNVPIEHLAKYLASASDQDRIPILHSFPPDVIVDCRLIESATALVKVVGDGGSPADAQTAMSKAGTAAEMRFLNDPTTTPVGGDINLKTYVAGDVRGNVKVTATFVPPPPDPTKPQAELIVPPAPLEFVTDAKGVGRFRPSRAGTWRLEMHAAKRLMGDQEARVDLHAATVMFTTGGGAAPEKQEPAKKDGAK